MKHWILAITGGSGAPIAKKILEVMTAQESLRLTLIVSDHARDVFRAESGIDLGVSHSDLEVYLSKHFNLPPNFYLANFNDMAAKISSGSNPIDGMIIAPCSMSTIGAIANGITMNLIHRAASVMLKERKKLILIPRESPFSTIHLKNMLELSTCGAYIVPATTTFYHHPKTVEDMVDAVAMKALDLAEIPHSINRRWKGENQKAHESHSRI